MSFGTYSSFSVCVVPFMSGVGCGVAWPETESSAESWVGLFGGDGDRDGCGSVETTIVVFVAGLPDIT